MFPANVYVERRNRLRNDLQTGVLLFLGNNESPMNYADNPYPFRQDSSFLYFFGLDSPGLAAVIDIDENKEIVCGADLAVDDIVWTGPQPSLRERCRQIAVHETGSLDALEAGLKKAREQGRPIHFLPPYRAEHVLRLKHWLGIDPTTIKDRASVLLIKAVVAQRSKKSPEEIAQIEAALDTTYEMQTLAMRMARPGALEREVAGAIAGLALSRGVHLAFPTILSVHGEILHNPFYGNVMKEGNLVVHDSGAESPLHYASDITRTIPVGRKFAQKQKEIYSIVLDAQKCAMEAVKPGVEFRSIHRLACHRLASGLRDLGLMKGNVEEAVEAGAHTLFFPCGVGHMLGLDVHDMEALGEDYVGYSETIRRNPAFGWKSLRLAKAVEPGFVVTVEPGIYFNPELIARWKADEKCSEFINYDRVVQYSGFGGIRIEDDVLVTESAHRILGKKIPKTFEEMEAMNERLAYPPRRAQKRGCSRG